MYKIIKEAFYILFSFCNESLKSGAYFIPVAHLSSDQPHFKGSGAMRGLGYCMLLSTGQKLTFASQQYTYFYFSLFYF